MRIAFVLTQSLESPSGLGRYLPLSKELARLGHSVTILALHPDYAACRERRFTRDGVAVYYVAQMHVRKVGTSKTYFRTPDLLRVSAVAAIRLTWALTRIPYDVVHLGKPQPINGLAAMLGSLLPRSRPLYVDCDDYEAGSNRFSGEWQRRVVTLFEDRLPTLARGITVNTPFLRERCLALGVPADRIVLVPNGVDRDRFAGGRQGETDRLRLALSLEGAPVVLYVGSLSLASHPVDLLVRAFALTRANQHRATLVIVGGGEDYDKLRSLALELRIEQSVRFVGRVAPEMVPAYYALASFSVEPVFDDDTGRARSPLKVVESLAAGTPVVAGDVGDRRAMLDGGRAGLLVKPGDAAALADGFSELIGSPVRLQAMAVAAVEIRQRYYWDVLVTDFARVYSD
jgi:glycosyltransferase involved in cell wall biosynthesis